MHPTCRSSLLAVTACACAALTPAQILIPGALGPIQPGAYPVLFDLAGDTASTLVAAGFDPLAYPMAAVVAQWNGTTWASLNPPVNAAVISVARRPNGDVIAGLATGEVLEYAGGTWTSLGMIAQAAILDLAVAPSGNVFACGSFQTGSSLLEWDGTSWSAPAGGLRGDVYRVIGLGSGDMLACGSFQIAGSGTASLARWDGTTWTRIQDPIGGDTVRMVCERANGNLVVAHFTAPNGSPLGTSYIAEWDGAGWTTIGTVDGLDIWGLVELPAGDLVVTGGFNSIDGVATANLARYSVSTGTWFAFANAGGGIVTNAVTAARFLGDMLVVGGGFTFINGSPEDGIAAFGPSIPGVSAVIAPGCAARTLQASTRPEIGAIYQTTATSPPFFPFGPIALGVRGLAQLTPPIALSALFPGSPAACNLHVTPDLLDTLVPSGTTVDASFPIPASTALIGAVLFHQVVDLLPDGTARATPARQLTIGVF